MSSSRSQVQFAQEDSIVLVAHNDLFQELLSRHVHPDARERLHDTIQPLTPQAPHCTVLWCCFDFRRQRPITDLAVRPPSSVHACVGIGVRGQRRLIGCCVCGCAAQLPPRALPILSPPHCLQVLNDALADLAAQPSARDSRRDSARDLESPPPSPSYTPSYAAAKSPPPAAAPPDAAALPHERLASGVVSTKI